MNPNTKLTWIGIVGGLATAVGDYVTNNSTITLRGIITGVVVALLGKYGAGQQK